MGRNQAESGGVGRAEGRARRDDAPGGEGQPGGWQVGGGYKGHIRSLFEGITPKAGLLGDWDDGRDPAIGHASL